jgi:hypothetical protein
MHSSRSEEGEADQETAGATHRDHRVGDACRRAGSATIQVPFTADVLACNGDVIHIDETLLVATP